MTIVSAYYQAQRKQNLSFINLTHTHTLHSQGYKLKMKLGKNLSAKKPETSAKSVIGQV